MVAIIQANLLRAYADHYKSHHTSYKIMASLETIPEAIGLARRAGLESVADRLNYLYQLERDNGDEPINQDTVNVLVSFMVEHPEFIANVIAIGSSGCVHATWDITTNSTLDAKFLPSGNVRFIYAIDNKESEGFKVLKKGEVSPNEMFKAIMPFIEKYA